jgi:hypothetical protein
MGGTSCCSENPAMRWGEVKKGQAGRPRGPSITKEDVGAGNLSGD